MGNFDIVLVAIFLICTIYVIGRAIDQIDDRTKITWNADSIKEQLQSKTLGETPLDQILEINFKIKPTERFVFDTSEKDKEKYNGAQPKTIDIVVKNKSDTINIYVDWDRSTLTDFGDAARRVVRLDGGKKLANFSPTISQPPSIVTPKTSLTASITAENSLKANDAYAVFEPNVPIVDLHLLYTLSKKKGADRVPPLIKLQSEFMNRHKPLEFYLSLMLRLLDLNSDSHQEQMYRVRCQFQIAYMPWHDHLPWFPKL